MALTGIVVKSNVKFHDSQTVLAPDTARLFYFDTLQYIAFKHKFRFQNIDATGLQMSVTPFFELEISSH
jgi:hypothetical protein